MDSVSPSSGFLPEAACLGGRLYLDHFSSEIVDSEPTSSETGEGMFPTAIGR
jgi:hypothetical protein